MCIATVRNMTGAIKIRDALIRGGIYAEIVSVDASITRRGCAYGVSFQCSKVPQVKRILNVKRIEYGEIMGEAYD
ncbi:MAG: DUF3343 domain-containing protein [Clostridia bacterium]|nr:DUF3343 domain-containing protein [Clostridia bacterium]